jgi:prepilin-type N-terminal cleavage/methylation domain-containing protein
MEKKVKRGSRKGFTLIELLIVIGLLGALSALILPSLSADREKALADVCDYNQAGTLRTLQQYYDIYGIFPNNLHVGLDAATTAGIAMPGLPEAQVANMVTTGDNYTAPSVLTDGQAESLFNAGITNVAYGTGYNLVPICTVDGNGEYDAVDGDVAYPTVTDWTDDASEAISFNGLEIADWEAATNPYKKAGRVLCFWITPTLDWDNHKNTVAVNKDWTKGGVDLKVSLPGKCPIPVSNLAGSDEPDFSYYMAYVLAFNDATKAVLIGSSCPEDGVLNP